VNSGHLPSPLKYCPAASEQSQPGLGSADHYGLKSMPIILLRYLTDKRYIYDIYNPYGRFSLVKMTSAAPERFVLTGGGVFA
jgi:hypothetical protein